MARGFAQQSDGGFAIASTPAKGTTVTLWFPRANDGDGDVDAAVAETVSPVPAASVRVLVVDDDPMVREMLTRELQELDFETSQASDGLSALAYLDRGEKVDLMITDLSMPGMNGVLLTKEARQRRATLPVMLLTGYADANLGHDLELMRDEGVILLRKPVVGQELARHATVLLRAQAEASAARSPGE
jgi:CheY-like chemotaxis protein